MALKGTLKDFAITDIFQLLHQQGKGGVLTILAGEDETQVVFEKGAVVLARFTKGHTELRLCTMLYRAGVISKNQLDITLNEHKKSMKNVGDVLISRKYIDEPTLSEFLNLQTREVLFRVLQWKNGAYKFQAGPFNYNKQIIKPISTDYLLMDGVRQLDEWPMIVDRLPSFDSLYGLTGEGERLLQGFSNASTGDSSGDDIDAAFAAFDEAPKAVKKKAIKGKLNLEENEKRILGLFNGFRSLSEVIDRSRLGRFDACKGTVTLLDHGLIQLIEHQAGLTVPERRVDPSSAQLTLKLLKHFSGYVVLTIWLLGISLFGARLFVTKQAFSQGFPYLKYLGDLQIRDRLLLGLEVYEIENQDVPDDLRQVLNKGLITPQVFRHVDSDDFYYVVEKNNFKLLPPPR